VGEGVSGTDCACSRLLPLEVGPHHPVSDAGLAYLQTTSVLSKTSIGQVGSLPEQTSALSQGPATSLRSTY
jgi:hypothetical protein